jgi:hypothetical protein
MTGWITMMAFLALLTAVFSLADFAPAHADMIAALFMISSTLLAAFAIGHWTKKHENVIGQIIHRQ